MSAPHVDNVSTIPEAADYLWPLVQENNSSLVLEPSMFHCQEGRNIEKELLEDENVHQKDDQDYSLSTSIQVVLHQWSFPRVSSSSSLPIMAGDELDSLLFLQQENSALPDHNIDKALQKELQDGPSSENGLLSPVYASDYACSLLPFNSTSLSIEDNVRTDELDSSRFVLEPLEPNMEEGYNPIDNSLSAPLEDSKELDLLLQECSTPLPSMDEKTRDDKTDLSLVPEQECSAVAEPSSGEVLVAKRFSAKNTRRNNYRHKVLQTGNKEVQADEGEGSTVKKQEHNAKERIRRMKLHASYLALGALIPDSSRSKKRKSAPLIIDRAVEYIPELEEEIEKLTLRKNDMLSTIKHKQPLNQNPHLKPDQDPSVSVHEIRQGEVITQIYSQIHPDDAFSNLLQKVEEEGTCIMSASTLQVSDDGVCYHLHIQQGEASSGGANHLASLREKVISWLR
ncbi:hypothetical protein QUC31_015361 [Theobroma cacao]